MKITVEQLQDILAFNYILYDDQKKIEILKRNSNYHIFEDVKTGRTPDIKLIYDNIDIIVKYLNDNSFTWFVTPLPATLLYYTDKENILRAIPIVVKTININKNINKKLDEIFYDDDNNKMNILLYNIGIDFIRFGAKCETPDFKCITKENIFNCEIVND